MTTTEKKRRIAESTSKLGGVHLKAGSSVHINKDLKSTATLPCRANTFGCLLSTSLTRLRRVCRSYPQNCHILQKVRHWCNLWIQILESCYLIGSHSHFSLQPSFQDSKIEMVLTWYPVGNFHSQCDDHNHMLNLVRMIIPLFLRCLIPPLTTEAIFRDFETPSSFQQHKPYRTLSTMGANTEYSEAYLHQSKQSQVIGVVVLYIILEVITLILRQLSKQLGRVRWGLDDALIFLGFGLCMAVNGTSLGIYHALVLYLTKLG